MLWKKNVLVKNVRLRILSDFVMLLTIKDCPKVESKSVISCIVLNKDLLTRPNRLFTTQYQLGKVELMEQRTLKNVNNSLNTNIYSFLETSGGQSSNLYLNVVHFFNTSVN
jgi:hypothetical protein